MRALWCIDPVADYGRLMRVTHAIAAVLLLAGLTGCVGTEIAEEVHLDYSGDLRDAVVACALEAADGRLRDDARVPSDIRIGEIGHSHSPRTGAAEITGVVRAFGASEDGSTLAYSWRCTTDTGGDDPTIVAFERLDG